MTPTSAPSPLTYAQAALIADEQIAHWLTIGVGPDLAWRALGLPWGWSVRWNEVRGQLVQSQLRGAASVEAPRLAA